MNFDRSYFYRLAKDILTTPSPSGFTHSVIQKIEGYATELGLQATKTNKGNLIVEMIGLDETKTLGLSAHVDTLGLMVRSINSDGTLRVTSIGGNQINSLIGEYCIVHTRNQKTYEGTILTTSPSSHVYDDTAKKGQNADEIVIRLDEVVLCKQDVLDLGIENGDFISIDPKTVITDSGFIKSRHIDDKISVALIFTVFKALLENNIKPNHTIKFVISTYEEVGHGAAHIPADISRLIAVDMGCIGKDLSCTEYDVSICAKDSSGPYDYEMTSQLISLAKKHELSYAVDIYPFYGSDASAALRGGHDIKAALIGPGVHASHGMERTHVDGCENVMKLLHAYLCEIVL
ncbi:MAG: M42 family metallopeptidase [Turicibacter sp.]